MPLTTQTLREGMIAGASNAMATAEELNEADAKLGDGDLGVSVRRGGEAVLAVRDDLSDDVGMALMQMAQALTRMTASSFNTLIATGLMGAAKAAKGRTEIEWQEVAHLLDAALDAMKNRGRGELGQKTLLDAVAAAAEAARDQTDPVALRAAVDAATEQALVEFRDRESGTGRARIFADRSVGLDDPGMLAIRRIVEGLSRG